MNDVKVTRNAYVKDGKEYIRVTRVLDVIAKPEFYRWFAKYGWEECTKQRDDRAAFGTRIHKEIQNFLEGKTTWMDSKEMTDTFQLFVNWYNRHKIEPVKLEYNLFNEELMIAGTCDFIGYVDDVLTIIDWKTSKKIYDNYPLQLAAYMWMYDQAHPDDDIKRGAIMCFRDGKVHIQYLDRDEMLRLVDVFRCVREVYRWKMASKVEKKEKIMSEIDRLNIIKIIAKGDGFKSVPELQDILKDNYGVNVHIDTLYTDLMRLELFSKEDFKAFGNKIIANCSAHLENLNYMSTHAKYEQYRIKAIDSFFKNSVEMIKLMKMCAVKEPDLSSEKLVSIEDEIPVIKFGEKEDEKT